MPRRASRMELFGEVVGLRHGSFAFWWTFVLGKEPPAATQHEELVAYTNVFRVVDKTAPAENMRVCTWIPPLPGTTTTSVEPRTEGVAREMRNVHVGEVADAKPPEVE
ncbi:unnamed protein product [Ectocarpus sp. 6 AP-2014]